MVVRGVPLDGLVLLGRVKGFGFRVLGVGVYSSGFRVQRLGILKPQALRIKARSPKYQRMTAVECLICIRILWHVIL